MEDYKIAEERVSQCWIEEWINYEDEDYNGYITSARINKLIKLNLLIGDTLSFLNKSSPDLIPWLKNLLPNEDSLSMIDNEEYSDELLLKTKQLLATVGNLLEKELS